ncbi:hypothetical protein OE88DRAFT_1664701 [Heliocybe sulcata]|uniref:Uncharacterized protein n=1 Tax=Heliocybe sulcata TaxID=5364 RepID=A0A5C3MTF9_9AGAM|nr:hypothetical protein OE88DRAFT_1664701 [Heliocybe sulcata]
MPRAKRTKISSLHAPSVKKSTRKTRSSDVDVEERVDGPPATPELTDDDKSQASTHHSAMDEDAQSVASSSSSRLTDEDPALLDEEETPGAAKSKAGKSYGGGGYDALKSFNGQMYSGMSIGGSHTWNYDQGVWKETKEEPDLWRVEYETTKRRARKAPKGSGAPVGTEYHWLIVAHQVWYVLDTWDRTLKPGVQHVKKIDANTYETRLEGSKYKLAHKNARSKAWSVPSVKGQREREVFLLEDAKRRVEGLPPVLASEKVKVGKGGDAKGQVTLESLFGGAGKGGGKGGEVGRRRKREGEGDEAAVVDAS